MAPLLDHLGIFSQVPEMPGRMLQKLALPFTILAAAAVAWYATRSVYWRIIDDYDDTGYMLAIFKQLADGGALYSEVFSQYGPFHGQAWLALFAIFGAPIDYDHLGQGVIVFWTLSACFAGLIAWRMTRHVLSVLMAMLWTAWALSPFTGELGHPVSLCTCLTFASLACVTTLNTGRPLAPAMLALCGAFLSALALTKINLGVFQLTAIGLALLFTWNQGRRLSWLGAVSSLSLPILLVGPAWPWQARTLLMLVVSLPTLMLLALYRQTATPALPWKREAAWWLGGMMSGASVIAGITVANGTSLAKLLEGILLRPLQLPGVFSIPTVVAPSDVIFVLLSLALAITWLAIIRRRDVAPAWWSVATLVTGISVLTHSLMSGGGWSLGTGSLVWLPAAMFFTPGDNTASATKQRLMLALSLATIWQALGTFPVSGAQIAIPAGLNILVWVAALADMAQACNARKVQTWANAGTTTIAAMSLVTLWLAWNTIRLIDGKAQKFVEFSAIGTSRYSVPLEQAALYSTINSSLKATEGPLFTSHGLNSLVLWSGKPFVNGYNCTYISGILRPEELNATLSEYLKRPSWSCVVYNEGKSFGKGPLSQQVSDFIAGNTRPWFRLQDYEVRLSLAHPSVEPKHAIWKSDDVWKASAPRSALVRAKKWRLRAAKQYGSGRWSPPHPPENSDSEPSTLLTVDLPKDVADALNRASPEDLQKTTFWLCDMKWNPRAGVACLTDTH